MTFQTVSPSEFDVYHVACILSQKCIQLHRFKVLRCCHRNSKQQWIKQNRSFSFSREIVWVSQARTSMVDPWDQPPSILWLCCLESVAFAHLAAGPPPHNYNCIAASGHRKKMEQSVFFPLNSLEIAHLTSTHNPRIRFSIQATLTCKKGKKKCRLYIGRHVAS